MATAYKKRIIKLKAQKKKAFKYETHTDKQLSTWETKTKWHNSKRSSVTKISLKNFVHLIKCYFEEFSLKISGIKVIKHWSVNW